MLLTLALGLVLTQDAPAEAAPSADAEAAPPGASVAPPITPRIEAPPARQQVPDGLTKLLQKLKDAPPDQRPVIVEELQRKFGAATVSPVLPPADLDLSAYRTLSDVEQAKLAARDFIADVLAMNIGGAISRCGLPFHLEERRVDRPDDLRTEWAKHLRGKRTDRLSLFDVEVLTSGEMEKKYGRPPQRLNGWPWRTQGTLLAVANLSGHAAVLMLRQVGATWQVVGFSD